MRIGLFEFLLIVLIAALTVGPTVALWGERWLRRAQKTQAMMARRRAAAEAQRLQEREAMLLRFRRASVLVAGAFLLGLAYALLLRPIDAEPQAYTAPEAPTSSVSVQTAQEEDLISLGEYETVSCIRREGDWLYLAAQTKIDHKKTVSALLRLRGDGSAPTELLTVDGEITGFAFDPAGTLWLTVADADGGGLYRADYDGWGAALEQVVRQIDGSPLGCPMAVVAGPDGKIYFADAASFHAEDGVEAALRTELLAHSGTGWVYVYDPAARTVERVLGGIAGASGLALSADGETLYISDCGNRCVWAVATDCRELTAGGRDCAAFASALPGYPGALALDEDGSLLISYRWAFSAWLEDHADGTLLRRVALRLRTHMQESLFHLGSDDIAAGLYGTDGAVQAAFGGKHLGSVAAVCSDENRIYFGIVGEASLRWIRV